MPDFIQKFRSLSPRWRAFIQATLVGVAVVIGPILEQPVAAWFTDPSWTKLAHVVVALLCAVPVFFITSAFATAVRERTEAEKWQQGTRLYAARLLDEGVAEETAEIFRDVDLAEGTPIEACMRGIRATVTRLFRLMEARHPDCADSVDFEVTFISKSMIDSELTIYAWKNPHERMPPTLELRRLNPKILEESIASQIYKNPVNRVRVIENTATDESYKELYPGQAKRLASSIVFGVMSPQSIILGAIVVHCNRALFFKKTDAAFWSDVLEPFAKRIALFRVRLEMLVTSKGGPPPC